MSNVDQQKRLRHNPRAAVLSADLASLLGDQTARLTRKPERALATSAAIEIRDQELIAPASPTPADDRHALTPA